MSGTVAEALQARAEQEALRTNGILGHEEEQEKVSEPKVIENLDAKVKLKDGSELTVKELQEGNLRLADYTRKTQKLSEEKKTFEAQKGEYEVYIKGMQEYWQNNPEEYQRMVTYFEKGELPEVKNVQKGKEPVIQATPNRSPEYDRMISDQNKKLSQLEDRMHQDKVDKAIGQFKAERNLSEEEMGEVLKVAVENVVTGKSPYENLQNAYRLWDYENAYRKGALEEEQRRLQKQEAQFLGGASRGGSKRKTDADLIKEHIFAKSGPNIL